MKYRTRLILLMVLSASALNACVSTRVTSTKVGPTAQPLERAALVVKTGRFASSNTAGSLGQRNLDSLVPNLITRLPVVFTLNGIPARSVVSTSAAADPLSIIKLESNEKLIVLTPVSATYSSRGGQALVVEAELIDTVRKPPVWRAEIRLATLGFGKFDQKVADDVASQLLDKLRSDGIARIPDGPIRTQ